MSVVWTEPFTTAAPASKKRKDTPPEYKHTNEEWEERRDRITELFEENELPDVAAIMAEEGFEASIPQYRNHLKNWGHWKYLKLSEKQWRYIGQNLMRRADEGKDRTAFKLNHKKIPSSRIEKDLAHKAGEDNFDLASLRDAISVSSCEMSAYTSSTVNGVRTFHIRNNFSKAGSVLSVQQSETMRSGTSAAQCPPAPRNMLYHRLQNTERSLFNMQQKLAAAEEELRIANDTEKKVTSNLRAEITSLKRVIDGQNVHIQQLQSRQEELNRIQDVHAYYEAIVFVKNEELEELGAVLDPDAEKTGLNIVHHAYQCLLEAKDASIAELKQARSAKVDVPPEAPEPPPPVCFILPGVIRNSNAYTPWTTTFSLDVLMRCFRQCALKKYPYDGICFIETEEDDWIIKCEDCPDAAEYAIALPVNNLPAGPNAPPSEIQEFRQKISSQFWDFEKSHLASACHRENVLSAVFGRTQRTDDGFISAGIRYDNEGRAIIGGEDIAERVGASSEHRGCSSTGSINEADSTYSSGLASSGESQSSSPTISLNEMNIIQPPQPKTAEFLTNEQITQDAAPPTPEVEIDAAMSSDPFHYIDQTMDSMANAMVLYRQPLPHETAASRPDVEVGLPCEEETGEQAEGVEVRIEGSIDVDMLSLGDIIDESLWDENDDGYISDASNKSSNTVLTARPT